MSSWKAINTLSSNPGNKLADAENENTKLDEQTGLLQLYQNWAQETARHHDQAIILLVGHSGHGKSKTINRLIGHNLLQIGRVDKLGSTTKAVQRVKMPVPASNIEPAVTLALDDTPGYADNTYDDRGANLALIKIYQERYFSENAGIPWRRYPNIILLVTSWNTITVDAYNAPECFTSPIGQSMFKLSHAGLVDIRRTNVIVVVTKSLSFMSEFDDCKTQHEKHEQWNIEAGRRRGIITDLQRKVFPKSIPWPIVFIENGGGQHVHHRYPTLPNGELSHQNLFDAIRGVIEQKGPKGASDLAGVQALRLITGAEPFGASYQLQQEILLDNTTENIPSMMEDSDILWTKPPCSGRSRELADQFLGVTYDPISGSYGRTCVLDLGPSEVGFRKGSGAETYFTQADDVHEENTAVATRLRCDFDVPNLARLNAHYSTSDGVKHARNSGSHLYVAQHLMEEAALTPLVRCGEAAIQ
ncbi:Protein hedgehog [Mycena venus]|uniref:Protein hedgehog n=1 Tax=Mycena venus TaxID=2733690 RepID=A0A8H7DBL4_9AGAR|nr:Protein hedgehog [Mycena venus]